MPWNFSPVISLALKGCFRKEKIKHFTIGVSTEYTGVSEVEMKGKWENGERGDYQENLAEGALLFNIFPRLPLHCFITVARILMGLRTFMGCQKNEKMFLGWQKTHGISRLIFSKKGREKETTIWCRGIPRKLILK